MRTLRSKPRGIETIEPDRYSWTAVEHRERGGGLHVHVLAARCDLETGRSLNIAPSGLAADLRPVARRLQLRARLETGRRPGARQDAAAQPPRLRRSGNAADRAGDRAHRPWWAVETNYGGLATPVNLAPSLPSCLTHQSR